MPPDLPPYCDDPYTPILVDLEKRRPQYHLTSAADGVQFDLSADGVLEQVAWTNPNLATAFLVLDRNGNGVIDNGKELFGNATPKRDGSVARNGFEALLDLDGGPAVSDSQITPSDAAYTALRLWIDRNHNGKSEVSELMTLSEAGLVQISTIYTESRRRDKFGNWYRFEGQAVMQTDGKKARPWRLFDVILVSAATQ